VPRPGEGPLPGTPWAAAARRTRPREQPARRPWKKAAGRTPPRAGASARGPGRQAGPQTGPPRPAQGGARLQRSAPAWRRGGHSTGLPRQEPPRIPQPPEREGARHPRWAQPPARPRTAEPRPFLESRTWSPERAGSLSGKPRRHQRPAHVPGPWEQKSETPLLEQPTPRETAEPSAPPRPPATPRRPELLPLALQAWAARTKGWAGARLGAATSGRRGSAHRRHWPPTRCPRPHGSTAPRPAGLRTSPWWPPRPSRNSPASLPPRPKGRERHWAGRRSQPERSEGVLAAHPSSPCRAHGRPGTCSDIWCSGP